MWEHPADRGALAALRSLKGFDSLVKTVFGFTSERAVRLLFLANAVKVGDTQFPAVRKAVADASEVLGMETPPETFVTQNPFLTAGAYGVKTPFIVVSSSFVDILDPVELQVLMGHETGHILSGHAVYKTLLWILLRMSETALNISPLILMPIIGAFRDWERKSELSADRAGLLATQDEEACYRLLMKMAGGKDVGQMNMNDFFAQAEEYENSKHVLDQLYKMLNTMNQTHPFAVVRLKDLKNWAATPDYLKILDGDYTKRSDDPGSPFDDFRSAGEHFSQEAKSGPKLSETIEGIGEALTEVADELGGAFREILGIDRNRSKSSSDVEREDGE
jgi:Zn-dependent protease with chaperone function